MSGGIPDTATSAFQLISLATFGLLVFTSLAKVRSLLGRGAIAVAATGMAFGLMLLGWLYYVIENGIDTL